MLLVLHFLVMILSITKINRGTTKKLFVEYKKVYTSNYSPLFGPTWTLILWFLVWAHELFLRIYSSILTWFWCGCWNNLWHGCKSLPKLLFGLPLRTKSVVLHYTLCEWTYIYSKTKFDHRFTITKFIYFDYTLCIFL